jgi:hypothetical protein
MSTSPLSPEDIRAAAETHAELGPEYGDAVLESFLAKVDREIDARVEERLGVRRTRPARDTRPRPARPARSSPGFVAGLAVGTVVTGLPLTWLVAWVAAGGEFAYHGRLLLVWAIILAVYMAGAGFVLNRKKRQRELAEAVQRGRAEAGTR